MSQRIKDIIKSEGFRYLFFGGLSTVFSIGSFELLKLIFDYKTANLISLVLTKVFTYITNKIFVFRSKTNGLGELVREAATFLGARLITSFLDYFGLIFMVETMGMHSGLAKIVLQVIIIALNYIFSKLIVFRKKENPDEGKRMD